ncbi:MAG TPA: hypothetical protein VEL28_01350 [Candidatus Binatia bacterium]|nr:hypothetical protein [Candidatus Binatia bacterium]
MAAITAPAAAARAAEVAVPANVAALLERGSEQVLARVVVPDEARRVGEVRIVRRGDVDGVLTVLHTKLMRRVVAEIREKEKPSWPAGAAGHDDSLRYLAALEAAQQELWSKVPQLDRNADQRQRLLIEFLLSKDAAAVVLSEFELDGGGDDLRIASRRPMAVLELSRDYVRRNMRLIIEDSFKKQDAELQNLIAMLPLLAAE